ncbi:MerR family transcriptional regulator [Alteromonas aestuariivivens]|nr:MerR family transcriptional regulator [Alteromonas aestuariivivens]
MADYTIEELEELTGIAKRTIRFYIQKGLVEPPLGARRTPQYTDRHLEQLLKVKQFKDAGLNLSKIADIMNSGGEVNASAMTPGELSLISRIHIQPGVVLDVDSKISNFNDDSLRQLCQVISDFVLREQGEKNND